MKHYIKKLPQSILNTDEKYNKLTCFEPPSVENENFLTLDEDRLLCAGNIELEDKIKSYGNTVYDFTMEPDVLFRDIQ